ncbi:MAG: hypothetical protein QM756_01550 [Polyangiaceae bacterium]
MQQAELSGQHATEGEATHVAAQCTKVFALLRLNRLADASRLQESMKAGPSEAPLTSTDAPGHPDNVAAGARQAGRMPCARPDQRRIACCPWVSQVPPVWWEVLTRPIEVYLAGVASRA